MSRRTTNPRTGPHASSGRRDPAHKRPSRDSLKSIADSTLDALDAGSYTHDGTIYDISGAIQETESGTRFFSSVDANLASWSTSAPPSYTRDRDTNISIVEMSTLVGARQYSLADANSVKKKVAILNFASATKPGGGFLTGAHAQEESIARSSTLHRALMTPEAQQFYDIHLGRKKLKAKERRDGNQVENGLVRNEAFYTHSMTYSPSVLLIKDDGGNWMEPCSVDVLTCAAPNAGVIRLQNQEHDPPVPEDELEAKIRDVIYERMGRILFLFEQQKADTVVLGSFGTGAFRNKVEVVARIWAELFGVGRKSDKEGFGRFKGSFEKAVFAIIDKPTYEVFKREFRGTTES